MSAADLVVRNVTAVLPEGIAAGVDVAVAHGRIAAIGPCLPGAATEERDATGLHLLPGMVDAHVHLDEPGRTEWEGWATGTRALAAGGVTTAVDMPLNALPPTTTAAAFDLKLAAAEASAVIDFGLWGGIVPGNRDDLDELAARGVVGFKAFMSRSGTEDFERADELTLYEGMERAARLGLPVAVHAESDTITAGLAARAVAEGRTGVRDYLASRPVAAELVAIAEALAMAEATGCALHVVHVSTGRGVELVAAARARGVDATCEVCPHHLVLDEEDAERLGAIAKCAPPLRPRAEVEALWEHVAAGLLPMVASDHSPAPPAMKEPADHFAVWGGIAGAQASVELLLDAGHHGRGLSLELVAGLLAGFPAERLRLAGKGRLAVGADADLVLVALDEVHEVRAEELLSRHPISPYVGRALRGRVVETRVHGRLPGPDTRGRLVVPTEAGGSR